ncbi:hypothetical protein MASR2M47_16300 [Draconibacterium sp.]
MNWRKLGHIIFLFNLVFLTTVKHIYGCSGTPPNANFNVDNAAPVTGQTITFTDASANNSGNINNRVWNFGTAAVPTTASGIGPHNVYYTSPGSKNATLTVSWQAVSGWGGIDAGSNTASKIINVTCNNPTPSISPKSTSVVYGSTLSLNGGPAGGSGIYNTHVWTGSGAIYLNQTNIRNPNFSGAPAGIYTLIYTVTDSYGCAGTDDITVTVTKKQLTFTAGNQMVTYGTHVGTVTQNGTYTISGYVNGDNSSVVAGLGSVSYNTNYTLATNAGTSGVTITPVLTGLSSANYILAAADGSITITKADQYISCDCVPFTKPLNEFTIIPIGATSTSGLPVTMTILAGSAATLNGSPGNYYLTDIGITGTVTLFANQAGNSNYNAAAQGSRFFDVTKSNQNISFPNINDINYHNGLALNLEATATSGLPITYTVNSGPATVSGSTLNINGIGEVTVMASQPGDASFNAAPGIVKTFNVLKGTQTITITVQAGALTTSTQITGTSTSGLPVTLTLGSGSAATGLVDSGSGYYTLTGIGGSGNIHIVGNQAGNANFAQAAQLIQTITIGKTNQTINFPPIGNKTYGDSPFSLNATATSGQTVSYSIVSGPASLSVSTLTITGAGTVNVVANQSGNGTYNPAPAVTQQFEVDKAVGVITQPTITKTFGDTDFTISPSTNSGGSLSFLSGNDNVFTIAGNTATIAGTGTTTLDIMLQPTADYFGAIKSVSFTVNKASSTINVTGATSYIYNDQHQGPDGSSVTGSSGSITYSYFGTGATSYGPSSMKPIDAGTYSVTATVAADDNYSTATSAPYNFTILKANPTINVTPYTVTYDGNPQTSVGSAKGISSENLIGLDLSNTTHTSAGTYTDNWTFTDVTGNYNDASGSVNNTINQASLSITANDATKCFGDVFSFLGTEFTSSGLIGIETIGTITLTSAGAAAGAVAGSYTIAPSNATGGTFDVANYSVTYNNGNMLVNPQPGLNGVAQASSVCDGNSATINLSGLLANSTFSLEYKINNIAQTPISGLSADASGISAFNTPVLTAANNGHILQITGITVTSQSPGCSKTFSQDVILSVNALPTLTGAAQASAACSGSAATIHLTGLTPGSTYAVGYTINGGSNLSASGLTVDGSGNSSFNTEILTTGNNGQTLNIFGIQNETTNCAKSFNYDIILLVDPVTVSGTPSANQTICYGTTPANITLTGSTGSIQWQVSTDNVIFTPISGATSSTLSSMQMGSLAATTYYRAQVTSGVCSPVNSAAVTVTVNDLPIIYALTGSSICASAPNTGTISLSNSQSGVSYQLKNAANANVQTTKSGSNGSVLSWTGLSAGNGYYVVVTGGSPTYCSSQTNSVDITVIPNPIIYTLTGSTFCASAPGTGTVRLSNSQTGVSYQLKNAANVNVQLAKSGSTGIALNWSNLLSGNGYYVVATGSAPTNCTSQTNAVNVTETQNPNLPTTTGAFICIGSPSGTQLSAAEAGATEKYKWYSAASAGTLLKTSINNTDNTYTTPVISTTKSYWVSIINAGGCESSRTEVIAALPSVSADSQSSAGTNSWIGHVYKRLDGTAQPPSDANAFGKYFGTTSKTEQFDENFGGDATCFALTATESPRSIYTEYYTVRYRMNSTTRKGIYVADMGSDDGIRLTVDGTKVFDHWTQRSYSVDRNVLFQLTGNSNLLFEFFESAGGNRVSFQGLSRLIENNLTGNISQSVCVGDVGAVINGDIFGTLPTGITRSGSGYQWAYSTNAGGPWINISGATAATYAPNTAMAPFNMANTYYIIRKAILSSTNNFVPNPYVTTNESNVATFVVNLPSTSEIIPD